MDTPAILLAYAEDYFEDRAALSYADLREAQDGSHASLALGAAGVAFACWEGGRRLGRPDLLVAADRWSREALDHQDDPLAFSPGTGRRHQVPPSSILYGRAGLYFVRALVADSLGETAARTRAVVDLAALLRASSGFGDLFYGTAGGLAAAAILVAHTADAAAFSLGERLSNDVVRQGAPGEWSASVRCWPGTLGPALGHGTAGMYLSLVLWSEATLAPLPAWFGESLPVFLRIATREPARISPDPQHYAWLCNGFAGLALLAAKACRVLGEPDLGGLAQKAVQLGLAQPPPRADLCCGRLGLATACLSLSGVDRGGLWQRHAEELVLSTLLLDRKDWWTSGLFGGEAALPCLALDVAGRIAAGPPCLDLRLGQGVGVMDDRPPPTAPGPTPARGR